MNEDRIRDFELIAEAWDDVSAATKAVECALPAQMTAMMARLIDSRKAMDAAIRAVGLRVAGRKP